MLIENQLSGEQIRSSILGIGMNINQDLRKENFPAVSLSMITGRTYDLKKELSSLCHSLERRYLQLRAGGAGKLKAEYLDLLFGKDELRKFRIGDKTVEGIITGVDPDGKLEVQFEKERKIFGNKEIGFVI